MNHNTSYCGYHHSTPHRTSCNKIDHVMISPLLCGARGPTDLRTENITESIRPRFWCAETAFFRMTNVTGDAKQLSACLNKIRTDSKVWMFSVVRNTTPQIDWWLSLKVLNDDNLLLLPLLFALGPRPRWNETGPTSKRTVLPNLNMLHWEWWFIYPDHWNCFFQPTHCQLNRYFFCWRRGTSFLQLVGWM